MLPSNHITTYVTYVTARICIRNTMAETAAQRP